VRRQQERRIAVAATTTGACYSGVKYQCGGTDKKPSASDLAKFAGTRDISRYRARVEPAWRDAQGETERHLWSTVLRPAAVELDEHAAELSRAVVPYISERMPDVVGSPEAWEVRRASAEATIRGFAEVLRSGADPVDAATLGSATLALVRDGAKRGTPVSVLLRSYRLAHAGVARHLYTILARHAADGTGLSLAIDLCSAWMFAYVDAMVCVAEDLYTSEREHWLRTAAAIAVETINTILSKQPIDIDVASRRLRHELRRVHVAAIAWIDSHEEGRDTLALLEAAIRDIAGTIGNQPTLIQPLGILSIAAWISTSAADRRARRLPRGQHHPLRRHRPLRTGDGECRAIPPLRGTRAGSLGVAG
jgi:hypothetical protein